MCVHSVDYSRTNPVSSTYPSATRRAGVCSGGTGCQTRWYERRADRGTVRDYLQTTGTNHHPGSWGERFHALRPKRIKSWEPTDFRLESTTVWSFKQRGSWATHDGRYRGNWSPYIPRNLILRYTKPGDLVLDPFVGGGTTAVEAKLLGRRCIARDINPVCVEMTLENLRFSLPRSLLRNLPSTSPRFR
jgi:hypothetical protein